MPEQALAQACEAAAATAERALAWTADPRNDPRVGQERGFLERVLRSQAYRARRLARSLERPMCVGVFGPSQSGKSYLVSVLARKGEALTAVFNDKDRPEIDFIRDINPYGEKEATGLVTRFSVEAFSSPDGYPVALRLLTQTDLLKILANAYFFDGDLQEEQALSPEDVDAHIRGFESRQLPAAVDKLREEDIWDVEEYFQHQIRRAEAKVFAHFWDRMARIAPRLSIADRAGLFSILWGRHEPLTVLYRTLLEGLERLGFAEEAYCPLSALVPATTSILNVEALAGLDGTEAAKVQICGGGRVVELPRPIVTALAAELRIRLKEAPWPFFAHTDLLDFPGYRSRTLHNLGKYLAEAPGGALKELFLRGKVDYLFQRYTAEQELTSMLLCLRPSNLDVTTLPAVIEEWIGVTHGRTPEERRGRPVLLFFLLTMFDQHLAEKAGDEGADPAIRFQARLEASLLKPFAKVSDAWPLRWTPEQAFQNCYWIRNPNYKAEGIIQYDGRWEVAVHPHKVARIAELEDACLRVPEVNRHFKDPRRAFEEVMRLNDGGISYLADGLQQVCLPGMKQAQIRARLQSLNKRAAEVLSPHFVPTDLSQRVAERERVAEAVIGELEECVARQRFGTFLRAFCLDRSRLADALYEARTRGTVNGHQSGPSGDASAVSTTPKGPSLLSIIKGADQKETAPRQTAATAPVRLANERTDRLARSALQIWVQAVHEAAEDEVLPKAIGVSGNALREVAAELIASARRLGLEEWVRSRLASVAHIDKAELSAAKATIVAERQINSFVTSLRRSSLERPVVFDAGGILPVPENFQQALVIEWVQAFYSSVTANAQTGDGLVHDHQQNALLGEIVAAARLMAEG